MLFLVPTTPAEKLHFVSFLKQHSASLIGEDASTLNSYYLMHLPATFVMLISVYSFTSWPQGNRLISKTLQRLKITWSLMLFSHFSYRSLLTSATQPKKFRCTTHSYDFCLTVNLEPFWPWAFHAIHKIQNTEKMQYYKIWQMFSPILYPTLTHRFYFFL